MSEPLFSFEHVVVELAGARVLDDVTTTIPAAGVTCLVGRSGSGKSTMLRLCNRLEVPTSGVVRFRGRDIATLDPLAHRRRVGMVFQRPTPFPGTVRDNLLVARPDASADQLEEALHRAALPVGFLARVADDLSGGEQQRVCLARTLIAEPEVLLMDEPTSALDEEATLELERLACGLACAERPVPVVWVSHDRAQVERIAQHLIQVDRGRVVGDAAGTGPHG